jgi:hypothetical protein
MEQTIHFQAFPTHEKLSAAISSALEAPFAIEIQQGPRLTPQGGIVFDYRQFIDCDAIADLHDFLCCDEWGVAQKQPFTVIIESIGSMPDDERDHPSLSAAERNPSMAR